MFYFLYEDDIISHGFNEAEMQNRTALASTCISTVQLTDLSPRWLLVCCVGC